MLILRIATQIHDSVLPFKNFISFGEVSLAKALIMQQIHIKREFPRVNSIIFHAPREFFF